MCTEITVGAKIEGSGKAGTSWFPLSMAYVSYDHPVNLPQEHSLNISFVNPEASPGDRVTVELTRGSAQELIKAISSALEQGEGVAENPMYLPGQRWVPPKRFRS